MVCCGLLMRDSHQSICELNVSQSTFLINQAITSLIRKTWGSCSSPILFLVVSNEIYGAQKKSAWQWPTRCQGTCHSCTSVDITFLFRSFLVGGWPTPLKNMSSSIGMMIIRNFYGTIIQMFQSPPNRFWLMTGVWSCWRFFRGIRIMYAVLSSVSTSVANGDFGEVFYHDLQGASGASSRLGARMVNCSIASP